MKYLARVAERDIDLLLMEEFHISDEFVLWFCDEIGIQDIEPAGAWHSVSDADGETDLLLLVLRRKHRVAILIENKVSAPEQELQAERYHLRGKKSRELGKFDEYRTVMCAPSRYLERLGGSTYDHRVSYEKIAQWFGAQQGRRATWRHHIMLEAIEQGRRGYSMVVNEAKTAFHLAYWEHLQAGYPHLLMSKPKKKGSKSDWIALKGHDFPKGVKLHHKFDQQVMELGFGGHRIKAILDVKKDWNDIMVRQKEGTATLGIKVPLIDMKLTFLEQMPLIDEALQAAYRLVPYASLLQAQDRAARYANKEDGRTS